MAACECREIMRQDADRHFKGCPLRKDDLEASRSRTKVSLMTDEALRIVIEALEARGAKITDFDGEKQRDALVGAIAMVDAMQRLGWKVTRP